MLRKLMIIGAILSAVVLIATGRWATRRFLAEPLVWPDVTAYYFGTFSIRRADGTFKNVQKDPEVIFVAVNGAELIKVSNVHEDYCKLVFRGKELWRGPMFRFSSDGSKVAIVSFPKDSHEPSTTILDTSSGELKLVPESWVSLGRETVATATLDPTDSQIRVKVTLYDGIVRTIDTGVNTFQDMSTSEGTVTLIGDREVKFFSPTRNWSYRNFLFRFNATVKVVNSYSCLVDSRNGSPLMGPAESHLELISEHNALVSQPCKADFLLVGDDAKRLQDRLSR